MAVNKSKSMDKMPARKMPQGFKMKVEKKIAKAEPTMKPLGTRARIAVEKVAATVKPKSSAKSTSDKVKITNVKVTTTGGPKPKTSVSGTSMAAKTKVTKPAPKTTSTMKPMTEAQKQAKALDALEAKRAAVAKKTGKRPNYYTN